MSTLFFFLSSLLCISSLFVFLTKNPVHSVLFLIFTFCNASSILILFKVDFLSFLYMIIYIGAIAVLFLFVVMMLNVKSSSTPYIFYLFLIFLCSVLSDFLYGYLASDSFFIDLEFSFENTFLVDVFSNIEVFGQVLFGYYTICFLLAGILLLVAMIGAIVLTLNFNATQKSGFGFKQFSRSNSIVFFK